MDVKTLRERAAEHRNRADEAKDYAVKESHLFLAEIYDEEADELAQLAQLGVDLRPGWIWSRKDIKHLNGSGG